MAENSISQKDCEINRNLEIIDDLSEYVSKMKALTSVALNCEIDNLGSETIYHYFWELDSLVDAVENVFKNLKIAAA